MLKYVYPNIINPLVSKYYQASIKHSIESASNLEQFVGENPQLTEKLMDARERVLRQNEISSIEDDIPF